MTYTWDKANTNTPTHRTTQYFEMLGNRAIYHDGWMAATTPATLPWALSTATPPDVITGYNWELYNVREDPTEADDLAARMPDKLKEMQELVNPLPVIDELAFHRSRKLIAFKHGRRLAKRLFKGKTAALTSYRRALGGSREIIGCWFAATVVQCSGQQRLGILGTGQFVSGYPREENRLAFRCAPKHV